MHKRNHGILYAPSLSSPASQSTNLIPEAVQKTLNPVLQKEFTKGPLEVGVLAALLMGLLASSVGEDGGGLGLLEVGELIRV